MLDVTGYKTDENIRHSGTFVLGQRQISTGIPSTALKELRHDILSCLIFCNVQNSLQREGNHKILVW